MGFIEALINKLSPKEKQTNPERNLTNLVEQLQKRKNMSKEEAENVIKNKEIQQQNKEQFREYWNKGGQKGQPEMEETILDSDLVEQIPVENVKIIENKDLIRKKQPQTGKRG